MAARSRLTIRSIDPDPRAADLRSGAAHLGLPTVEGISVADIVFLEGDLDADDRQRLHSVLVDPLLQRGSWEVPSGPGIEITKLAGVTDSVAVAVRHAAE